MLQTNIRCGDLKCVCILTEYIILQSKNVELHFAVQMLKGERCPNEHKFV